MADVGLAMQRAIDKTEDMKARANAVQELEAAGTFGDFTALGSGEDDIDRQLRELSSTSAVDSELEKMKAELGGGGSAPALPAGSDTPPHDTVEPETSDTDAATVEPDTSDVQTLRLVEPDTKDPNAEAGAEPDKSDSDAATGTAPTFE
jgi:hypothetical protein